VQQETKCNTKMITITECAVSLCCRKSYIQLCSNTLQVGFTVTTKVFCTERF